jgi:hypothetical protein
MSIRTAGLLILTLWLCLFAAGTALAADEEAVSTQDRVFELRTYICHEGKLPDLHDRFRDHTNELFIKHGMQMVGYWTPIEGEGAEDTLVYLLAFPSRDAREASWKAFFEDPEWQRAYADSRVDGPIVKEVISQILSPTEYSPIR